MVINAPNLLRVEREGWKEVHYSSRERWRQTERDGETERKTHTYIHEHLRVVIKNQIATRKPLVRMEGKF